MTRFPRLVREHTTRAQTDAGVKDVESLLITRRRVLDFGMAAAAGFVADLATSPESALGDTSTTLQERIDSAAAEGSFYYRVPAGRYELSEPLRIPNFFWLDGSGHSTLLLCTNNNYAIALAPGNCSKVTNLSIEAVTRQSAGGGVDFSCAGCNVVLEDISLGNNLFVGLHIAPEKQGAGIYHFNRIRANGVEGVSTAVLIGDGMHQNSGHVFVDCAFTSATATGIGNQLTIRGLSDSVFMIGCQFFRGGGAQIMGATECKFTNTFFDGMSGIAAVNVGSCENMVFTGCSIDAAPEGSGLNISPGAVGVRWIGGSIRDNHQSGVQIMLGSAHTLIEGALISDNNQSNSAFGHGITVGAGTVEFSILNSEIGNGLRAGGHQRYGVQIASGPSNRYIVTGNRFFGNDARSLYDGGTGREKEIGSWTHGFH